MKILERELTRAEIKRAREFAETPNDFSDGSETIAGTGTGFFVAESGLLLTAAHVVDGANKIEVQTSKGMLDATVKYVDQALDFALLKVEGPGVQFLRFAQSPKVDLGSNIKVAGYPNPEVQGEALKMTYGKINSLSGYRDDLKMFQISAPVQPGNSGGPLLDANNNVIGIITARVNDLAIIKQSGLVPQNVNYALKISAIKWMLGDMGVATESTSTKPASLDDVKSSTVLIRVYE